MGGGALSYCLAVVGTPLCTGVSPCEPRGQQLCEGEFEYVIVFMDRIWPGQGILHEHLPNLLSFLDSAPGGEQGQAWGEHGRGHSYPALPDQLERGEGEDPRRGVATTHEVRWEHSGRKNGFASQRPCVLPLAWPWTGWSFEMVLAGCAAVG